MRGGEMPGVTVRIGTSLAVALLPGNVCDRTNGRPVGRSSRIAIGPRLA
jgi:hypothetical protein